MATITALNVRLGMDASNFSAGADLARSEVNKVASVLRQSEPPAKKFQKEIELLDRAFSEAGKQTKEYAQAVEFLRKKHGQLPPEIKKTTSAVDQLKQSMMSAVPGGNMLANALKGPAGAAMALAAAVAVVAREVGKAAQRIDETAKAARGLGMAYSDLIALQMLASESGGIDAGSLNQGMGQFVKRIAEARVNGGALAETMKALGLDVGKLASMNPAEAFAQVADVIQGIPDHAERVRVAVSLFGKEGIKFVEVLAQGSAGLEKMRQESERLGTAISDEAAAKVEAMNDAFGRVGGSIQGIWNSITTALAPTLTNVAKLAEQFFVAVRKTGEVYATYSPQIQTVVFAVNKLLEGFRGILAVLQDIGSIISSLPGALFGGEINLEFSETNRLLDEMDAKANGTAAATKAASEAAEALAIEAERAAEAAAKQAESYESRVRQLQIESVALAGNTELAREMQLAAEGYTKEQIAALTAMERQNQAMKDRIKAEEEAAKAAEANRKKVLAELQKDIDQFKKEVDQINKEFESEVKSAMQAAKAYYEEQKRMDEKRRADVAKGPGAGMEEGSAAAAKFMADQVNAAIGAAAVPETPTPGEKEIAEKTRELLIAQQAANAAQLQELETQKALLEEFRQNKFTRFR
jgi:hypothetical protein